MCWNDIISILLVWLLVMTLLFQYIHYWYCDVSYIYSNVSNYAIVDYSVFDWYIVIISIIIIVSIWSVFTGCSIIVSASIVIFCVCVYCVSNVWRKCQKILTLSYYSIVALGYYYYCLLVCIIMAISGIIIDCG